MSPYDTFFETCLHVVNIVSTINNDVQCMHSFCSVFCKLHVDDMMIACIKNIINYTVNYVSIHKVEIFVLGENEALSVFII